MTIIFLYRILKILNNQIKLKLNFWSFGIKIYLFLIFILTILFCFVLFNNGIDSINDRPIYLDLGSSIDSESILEKVKKYYNIYISKSKKILKNPFFLFFFKIFVSLLLRVIIDYSFDFIFKDFIIRHYYTNETANVVNPFSLNENIFNNIYEINGLPFIPIKFNYSGIDRYSTSFEKFDQLNSSVQIEEIIDFILEIDVL